MGVDTGNEETEKRAGCQGFHQLIKAKTESNRPIETLSAAATSSRTSPGTLHAA